MSTVEQRVGARASASDLVEMGIALAKEEGLTDPELNRHFWQCVRETIDELIGPPPSLPSEAVLPPLEVDCEAPPDDEPFPFGKHKGEDYGDVPDSYFRWLSEQDWIDKWPEVLAYIQEHDLDV